MTGASGTIYHPYLSMMEFFGNNLPSCYLCDGGRHIYVRVFPGLQGQSTYIIRLMFADKELGFGEICIIGCLYLVLYGGTRLWYYVVFLPGFFPAAEVEMPPFAGQCTESGGFHYFPQ